MGKNSRLEEIKKLIKESLPMKSLNGERQIEKEELLERI